MKRRTFMVKALTTIGSLLGARSTAKLSAQEGTEGTLVTVGYGPCKHRSCNCYNFDGNGNTCKCGHNFYDHR